MTVAPSRPLIPGCRRELVGSSTNRATRYDEGACLKIGAGDYVQGPIDVVRYDGFRLDADGDGIGCES
jgi:hypothetical protein